MEYFLSQPHINHVLGVECNISFISGRLLWTLDQFLSVPWCKLLITKGSMLQVVKKKDYSAQKSKLCQSILLIFYNRLFHTKMWVISLFGHFRIRLDILCVNGSISMTHLQVICMYWDAHLFVLQGIRSKDQGKQSRKDAVDSLPYQKGSPSTCED